MPAALVIADLVTLEETRLYCLRDVDDSSYDALWAVLIPGISEAASLWADRQFTPQDDVTRDFPAAGWAGRTILSPWELREVHAISLDGADVDGGLFPIGGTSQGTYWSIEVAGDGAVLTVDGDWGMLEVPPAVKFACLIALDSYYQNTAGHASESLGGHSYSEVVSNVEVGGLPRASRTLLDNYRRISVT